MVTVNHCCALLSIIHISPSENEYISQVHAFTLIRRSTFTSKQFNKQDSKIFFSVLDLFKIQFEISQITSK